MRSSDLVNTGTGRKEAQESLTRTERTDAVNSGIVGKADKSGTALKKELYSRGNGNDGQNGRSGGGNGKSVVTDSEGNPSSSPLIDSDIPGVEPLSSAQGSAYMKAAIIDRAVSVLDDTELDDFATTYRGGRAARRAVRTIRSRTASNSTANGSQAVGRGSYAASEGNAASRGTGSVVKGAPTGDSRKLGQLAEKKYQIAKTSKETQAAAQAARNQMMSRQIAVEGGAAAGKAAGTKAVASAGAAAGSGGGATAGALGGGIALPVIFGILLLIVVFGVLGAIFGSEDTTAEALEGNERIVAEYLLGKGLEPLHVAAIMGNIEAESGFDSSAIEAGNGIGLGLCQWSFGRRTQLELYAASKDKPPGDINLQLDFLWAELTGEGDAAAFTNIQYNHAGFLATTGLQEAVYYFGRNFERPNEEYAHWDRRISSAQRIYNALMFGGGAGDPHLSGSGILNHPCPAGPVTSGFGWREEFGAMHNGIDFGAPEGTPYYAAESGVVTNATYDGGWNGGAGNWIVIDHGNGMTTVYMHSSQVYVSVGQYVTKGQNIGAVGNTGDSYGAHLHFEVRINGAAVNPAGYL